MLHVLLRSYTISTDSMVYFIACTQNKTEHVDLCFPRIVPRDPFLLFIYILTNYVTVLCKSHESPLILYSLLLRSQTFMWLPSNLEQ